MRATDLIPTVLLAAAATPAAAQTSDTKVAAELSTPLVKLGGQVTLLVTAYGSGKATLLAPKDVPGLVFQVPTEPVRSFESAMSRLPRMRACRFSSVSFSFVLAKTSSRTSRVAWNGASIGSVSSLMPRFSASLCASVLLPSDE